MIARIAALFVAVPALVFATAASAAPEDKATDFVRQGVDRGIAILNETGPQDPERFERFRTFVNEVIDTRSVALFVLGPYRRGADQADLDRYVGTFHSYATASYESRLGAYGGQTVEITGATARSDKDMLVNAEIRSAKGERLAGMAFRILDSDRGLRLFDVQVEGIWLAVEQRNQFTSFLAQNGGSIDALIGHLEKETETFRANAPDAADTPAEG